MAIKIITDSTCYLPEELLKKYNIEILTLSISFKDSEIYRESEVTNEEFYRLMEEYNEFPKSSQPILSEVSDCFEKHIKAGDSVVGVFLSSDMSGTYHSALMVREMVLENHPDGQIEIIDSRSNSMQLGYAVLEGAEAVERGENIQGVVNAIKDNIKRSKFIFSPDTLDYLKKGGRIGNANALIGKILQIKPILTVLDGKTTTLDKVRTKKKALKRMLDEVLKEKEKFGLQKIIVHHINCEEEGRAFGDILEKHLNMKIDVTPIGPVIGTHVGPGALGIVYCTEKELDRTEERSNL